MVATVDPLPGKNWGGRAVVGDALQRVADEDVVMVLWLDPTGKMRYSKNTINAQQLVTMASYLNYLCNQMWKQEEDG
jgi:hypothetical protein